jgi:hypothetical protein
MAYIKKGDLLLLGERKMIAVSDDYTTRMGGGGDYENDWHSKLVVGSNPTPTANRKMMVFFLQVKFRKT